MQQFFNNFVFKLEEALYKRENIPWDPLDFPDNADSVDILGVKNNLRQFQTKKSAFFGEIGGRG